MLHDSVRTTEIVEIMKKNGEEGQTQETLLIFSGSIACYLPMVGCYEPLLLPAVWWHSRNHSAFARFAFAFVSFIWNFWPLFFSLSLSLFLSLFSSYYKFFLLRPILHSICSFKPSSWLSFFFFLESRFDFDSQNRPFFRPDPCTFSSSFILWTTIAVPKRFFTLSSPSLSTWPDDLILNSTWNHHSIVE